MEFIKTTRTLKEILIENRVGEILKERKRLIFWMSSFGHTEVDFFAESNDKVTPLLSKKVIEVLLKQKRHET